jgi:hypothetical protein
MSTYECTTVGCTLGDCPNCRYVATLREDAARLDWLEASCLDVRYVGPAPRAYWAIDEFPDSVDWMGTGTSLRLAIDSARASVVSSAVETGDAK